MQFLLETYPAPVETAGKEAIDAGISPEQNPGSSL